MGAFKLNSTIKHCPDKFREEVRDLMENPPVWRKTCEMIRVCNNANFKVVVRFRVVGDALSDGAWLNMAGALRDNDSVSELVFPGEVSDNDGSQRSSFKCFYKALAESLTSVVIPRLVK